MHNQPWAGATISPAALTGLAAVFVTARTRIKEIGLFGPFLLPTVPISMDLPGRMPECDYLEDSRGPVVGRKNLPSKPPWGPSFSRN